MLTSSSQSRKLGITLDDEDMIEVKTSINIAAITHLSQNPDNVKLTNIYLTNGACITSPHSFDDIRNILESSTDTASPFDKFNI